MAISKIETNSLGSTSVIHSDTTLALQTNGTTTAVTINTSQNVGIGTSSPTQKLSVAGDVRVVAPSNGQVGITQGSSTNSGYLSLWDVAGTTRSGYVGYATLAGSGAFTISSDISTNAMVFQTAALERMRIDSSGNLLVGTNASSFNSKFRVVGSSSSADWAFLFQNSTPTNLLAVDGAGGFYTGSASASPYNNTTGSGANVYIGTAGQLFRSTSSLKYKENIKNATHGLVDVLKLRSVTYQSKNEKDNKQIFGGLIAEEVDEAGLKEFVVYAEDGTPDALHYGNMVSLCIKAIQELNAKVDAQAAEIAALKGAK